MRFEGREEVVGGILRMNISIEYLAFRLVLIYRLLSYVRRSEARMRPKLR